MDISQQYDTCINLDDFDWRSRQKIKAFLQEYEELKARVAKLEEQSKLPGGKAY
jgi:hypothetical protein